jgi:hypothetical protein
VIASNTATNYPDNNTYISLTGGNIGVDPTQDTNFGEVQGTNWRVYTEGGTRIGDATGIDGSGPEYGGIAGFRIGDYLIDSDTGMLWRRSA